ncbi:hypothetical protein HanIR_Chr10g0479251 [Helianthus annuus]|nr:hypothetical protein HanIR_Chr10g0479251 [Helianthus annuus]
MKSSVIRASLAMTLDTCSIFKATSFSSPLFSLSATSADNFSVLEATFSTTSATSSTSLTTPSTLPTIIIIFKFFLH